MSTRIGVTAGIMPLAWPALAWRSGGESESSLIPCPCSLSAVMPAILDKPSLRPGTARLTLVECRLR